MGKTTVLKKKVPRRKIIVVRDWTEDEWLAYLTKYPHSKIPSEYRKMIREGKTAQPFMFRCLKIEKRLREEKKPQ
jgi:hypothetical protein